MHRFRWIGLLALPMVWAAAGAPAARAGGFDGTWVIDVPASQSNAGHDTAATCPALRFSVQIRDRQVTGELTRVTSPTGGPMVESGGGRLAAPVTGTVQPDGTVSASWTNYHAAGKLAGDRGEVTVQGECGPRAAVATRVKN